jgi:IclR family transcriptional regulator, acetate operon repressor
VAEGLNGRVQSVDRALSLLEELARDDRGWRLTDLARRTGLSLTTAHRLLTTLEQRRFVQFSSSDNAWHIGQTAFAVGSAFARERNFVVPALPFLRRLRDQTRETANLGVVESGEIVLVNQVPSREIMRAISPVGGRAPMTASGMGKAILASYTRVDVDAVLRRHGMRRATCKTLTSRDALDAQLADARREGYSVDDEEFVTGLRCVAAPVYDDKAEVAFAVSVSGLPLRMTTERLPVLGRLVAKTAREITTALGGRPRVH